MNDFNCIDDVTNAVMELSDALAVRGEVEAAQELAGAAHCYYSTGSEALVEIRQSLERTRSSWEKGEYGVYRELAEHIMHEAKRLLRVA